MIALDTDIFTLLSYGHANVTRHYHAVPDGERIAVSAITRAEAIRGRTDSVLKAANREELVVAARRLRATEEALAGFQILPVNEAAADFFEAMLKQKKLKSMRRADMLIACVALAHDALLVTRNTKDYAKVAGLKLANWADD